MQSGEKEGVTAPTAVAPEAPATSPVAPKLPTSSSILPPAAPAAKTATAIATTTSSTILPRPPTASSTAVPPAGPPRKKKPKKRKEKSDGSDGNPSKVGSAAGGPSTANGPPAKKRKPRRKDGAGKDKDKAALMASLHELPAIDAAQQAVYDQMRRALNEDKYSAVGSIIEHTDSEEEDDDADLFLYRGQPVRLDRSAMQQTSKKMTQAYWYPALNVAKKKALGAKAERPLIYPEFLFQTEASDDEGSLDDKEDPSDDEDRVAANCKRKKDSFIADATEAAKLSTATTTCVPATSDSLLGADAEEDLDRDGGSIFGQTTGATNSTWVECDKCKKWRRLRGVVDEKKLPTKWYCSMNRNDPERARCSAPEEDYETQQTPESAADARTRKHLRVWVRRLQCQEAFEARQPTLTRGKKRATASSMKDPYEWVRCCNPSCGKWRAVLRFMDAKSTVCERTVDGEWYCVMNTWDEKMASCAAPQENLPAVGCPPWVMQDDA